MAFGSGSMETHAGKVREVQFTHAFPASPAPPWGGPPGEAPSCTAAHSFTPPGGDGRSSQTMMLCMTTYIPHTYKLDTKQADGATT